MKNLIFAIFTFGIMASCHQGDDLQTTATSENTPLKKELTTELPELSIYNLPSTWTTQDNTEIQLEEMRGKVLVMVMIYTSCKTACPRLIADMRHIESKIDKKNMNNMQFVIVSIDPKTDTPERLKEFSKLYGMEGRQWTFLRGSEEDTREFAAVLSMSYKRVSPMDFAHSNIISVFDEQGVLVHQKKGLGMDYGQLVDAINDELTN